MASKGSFVNDVTQVWTLFDPLLALSLKNDFHFSLLYVTINALLSNLASSSSYQSTANI